MVSLSEGLAIDAKQKSDKLKPRRRHKETVNGEGQGHSSCAGPPS